jgi:O-antigen/teichoic acid export membrane protein
MGLFLLVSGDRYLIAYFSDYDHVGIYNQTYNIGQLSIVALFTVISAALNPSLISELNKKPFDSDQKLYDYLYISVYLILPLTFLFSLFSKEITRILLGKDFREAWNILPLIFFSAFFSGANHFAVIKIKFTNKLRLLIIDSISAAALNIVLNLILIPLYGYKIAAATTFIAYVYLFIILFYHAGLNPFANRETGRKLVRIILILTGLFGVHLAIKHFISGPTLVLPIAETIIFVLIYYILTRKIVPLKGEQI